MYWWVTAIFGHNWLLSLLFENCKLNTAKNQYPAAYRTATVMPNRSLFRIPISTSLTKKQWNPCKWSTVPMGQSLHPMGRELLNSMNSFTLYKSVITLSLDPPLSYLSYQHLLLIHLGSFSYSPELVKIGIIALLESNGNLLAWELL